VCYLNDTYTQYILKTILKKKDVITHLIYLMKSGIIRHFQTVI